jgi:phosphoribosylamine--glycine ligase
MVTADGPKVLEFNCRFGDPETQVLLPLLDTDLLEIAEAMAEGRLDEITVRWREAAACGIVLAAAGYPGKYATGDAIHGLSELPADALAFHAGTRLIEGQVETAGGRVLTVAAMAPTLAAARDRAYAAAERVRFAGAHYRKDIAVREILAPIAGGAGPTEETPLVGIVMGSESDRPTMQNCADALTALGIPHEVRVMSAHRAPERVREYGLGAADRGLRVLIAGAGLAAHLPGVLAAWTTLPVIGVPLAAGDLKGLDSLYAIVQMPPGVPVATVGIGSGGARNAAYLAAAIIGQGDPAVRERYAAFRRQQSEAAAASATSSPPNTGGEPGGGRSGGGGR